MHERAESRGFGGFIEVRIFQNEEKRLAAEFQQHRLEVTSRTLGDDATDSCQARKIDPFHRGMINQRLNNGSSIR
jgi:hypothetical protein